MTCPSSSAEATFTRRSQNSARRSSCSAWSRETSRSSMTSQSYGEPTTFQPFSVSRSRSRAISVRRWGVSATYSRSQPEYVRLPRSARSSSSRTVPKTWMRMYVCVAPTRPSLAALLHEAVAAVGVLRDHDERVLLETRLAFQGRADEVVVLVLGRHADAPLGDDLGVEAPRADAQGDALTGIREELPGVLRDQDARFANVFGAEAVAIGGSGNAHCCVHFLMKVRPLLDASPARTLDDCARGGSRYRGRQGSARCARWESPHPPRAGPPRSAARSRGSRSPRPRASRRGSPRPARVAAAPSCRGAGV